MRKIFSLGLLALILSSISTVLLAGHEVCDALDLKDDLKDAGVYGWCNAWFDPEQTDGDHIADKIRERVAEFENETGRKVDLSWLDQAECPCWSTANSIPLSNVGYAGVDCGSSAIPGVYEDDFLKYVYLVDDGFGGTKNVSREYVSGFLSPPLGTGSFCYVQQVTQEKSPNLPISEEEEIDCRAKLQTAAGMSGCGF